MLSMKTVSAMAGSLGPLLGRALRNRQLWNPQCELTEPDPDILIEYDVKVPLPDGTVLLANVFRSQKAAAEDRPLPVIMCAHPYDNHLLPALGKTPFGGPPQQYRVIPQGGDKPRFSTITSWESPDPNFWVPAGYAVVNLNLPGYGGSGGPATMMSDHQSKSYYEAIEWVAEQPWSTGAIGLSGVSYLAITQFHVAACRHYGGPPKALKAISPWEGVTDLYRDVMAPGGVEDQGFRTFWWFTEVKPALTGTAAQFEIDNGGTLLNVLNTHPFADDWWAERAAPVDDIDVPMLVCASFSDQGLHTPGSFRAFTHAKSTQKWLYTHRAAKWSSYYSDEVQDLTRRFMDHFVKGDTDNGWQDTPRVMLEVRSSRTEIHERRGEQDWPLPGTVHTPLYLTSRGLSQDTDQRSSSLSYANPAGSAAFEYTFERDTELTGEMKLRVWVESRPHKHGQPAPDDIYLFTALDKLDTAGRPVRFNGSIGSENDWITRGYARAARRELDPTKSTPSLPVPTGTSHQPLSAGEIVPVEIALWPSSTFFHAGESIRLVISGKENAPTPPYDKKATTGPGTTVIHLGGNYDSHLLIPIHSGSAPRQS